jgi:hypothetical protein
MILKARKLERVQQAIPVEVVESTRSGDREVLIVRAREAPPAGVGAPAP